MRPIFTVITDRSVLAFELKPIRSVECWNGNLGSGLGHFADSTEKTPATKHVRIDHLISNQVNTRYRCLKLSVVQFNTPLSVLSKLLFTLSAAIISPRFVSSSGSKKHLQRCKHREMVRAAVHIYWGPRHWAWALPPLCSRRRGKAAREQNAWRHSDKCLACSVAVLCCFTAGRKV